MLNKIDEEKVTKSFIMLDDEKKDIVFTCIKYFKSVELNNLLDKNLTKKDIKAFKNLRNLVVTYISKNKKERTIIKKLSDAGLTKEQSKIFYDYCHYIAEPLSDAKYVKELDVETFKTLVDFFIYQIFIYKDYKNYFSDCHSEMSYFRHSKHRDEIMRFVHHHISEVLDRNVSPKTLKLLLELDFEIPRELIEVLYKTLTENIQELHIAHLFHQFSDIAEKVETISGIFEEIQESDEEEN